MSKKTHLSGFIRLQQVLELIPISRSAWYAGIQEGRYPKPVKLGSRASAWAVEDIDKLIQRLKQEAL